MIQLAKLQPIQAVCESTIERLKSREPLVIAHNVIMGLGVLAICTLVFMFVKPKTANDFASLSPFDGSVQEVREPTKEENLSDIVVGGLIKADKRLIAYNPSKYKPEQQRKWLGKWLSRRFHVAPKAIDMIVTTAYQTADELKLDPLLILAVISIESRYNPVAQSPVGAQGLMQVMTKVHRDKFEGHGGDIAALNPVVNIKVGSRILKEYVRRDGSVPLALKRYVGAANLETDYGYAAKVLGEYAKLRAVASGKRVRAIAVAAKPKLKTTELVAGQKPEATGQKPTVAEDASASSEAKKDAAVESVKRDELVAISDANEGLKEL